MITCPWKSSTTVSVSLHSSLPPRFCAFEDCGGSCELVDDFLEIVGELIDALRDFSDVLVKFLEVVTILLELGGGAKSKSELLW